MKNHIAKHELELIQKEQSDIYAEICGEDASHKVKRQKLMADLAVNVAKLAMIVEMLEVQ